MKSKTIKKIAVSGVLVIALFMSLAPAALFAAQGSDPFLPPAAEEGSGAGSSGTPAPKAKTGQSIPDTFSVGNYLHLDNQTNRVPTKDNPDEAGKGLIGVFLDGIDLFIKLIGSIALMVFIIGALLTIASEGKQDMLEKGKTTMVYAVIGIVVSLMAFIIVAFVQSILF